MKRRVIGIILIIIPIVALLYSVMPDLFVGPFDDGVIVFLALCAEIVLFIIRAVSRPSNPRPGSDNTNSNTYNSNAYNYQQNFQQNYQKKESDSSSEGQENGFQFFSGCTNWKQVKSRYRELMKKYHPDTGGNEEASKKINAEYNYLKRKYGH